MEKFIKTMVLIIWLSISIFEISTYLFVSSKPIYFRAWEAVSNYTGKDASIASFKPMYIYDGTMTGDLLNAIKFKPLPSEIRKQTFIVDEYGYRNKPGFLNEPIDAVIIGSSFVGGGQETQDNLVSSILTDKYGIRTYNSTTSVQYFWEDERFKKNQPKYVIFLGSEGEIINSMWKYQIVDGVMNHTPKAWKSFEEWKKVNESFPTHFDKIADRVKNYSLTRYFSNNIYIDILNLFLTRKQIADTTTQDFVTYHSDSKTLFWQEDYDDPLINTQGKTEDDIKNAIKELVSTRNLLRSRGITFIVAGMPSKTHLELKKYRDIPNSKRALYVMDEAMKEAGIEYVDLLTPTLKIVKDTNTQLYYSDDSHWNSEANELISKLLKEKIYQLNAIE